MINHRGCMDNNLVKLGEIFKLRRSERGLSLKEVENATSIRMNYLKAIEEGNLQHKITPVYAEGFIKQYAKYLGLDGEKMLQETGDVLKKMSSNQEFAYGLGTLEVRGSPSDRLKSLPTYLWIIGGAFILLMAWLFAKYLGVL